MSNPSTHVFGRKRDQRILAHLEVCKCLSQEQIHWLEFWDVSTEMSRRCTRRLEKSKFIRRVSSTWSDTPDWFYLFDSKRPEQIQHTLGKAWLYTALHVRALAGNQNLIFYSNEETKFLPHVRPDAYAVMEHKIIGRMYLFGEFQITESGNKWAKDYAGLFRILGDSEPLSLMVVTAGDYAPIKRQLALELADFKNVRLEFYTLERLKVYCRRIAAERK